MNNTLLVASLILNILTLIYHFVTKKKVKLIEQHHLDDKVDLSLHIDELEQVSNNLETNVQHAHLKYESVCQISDELVSKNQELIEQVNNLSNTKQEDNENRKDLHKPGNKC